MKKCRRFECPVASGAGMVHHDVKASNVLRHADGRIRLIDFGYCTPVNRSDRLPVVGGTPLFGSLRHVLSLSLTRTLSPLSRVLLFVFDLIGHGCRVALQMARAGAVVASECSTRSRTSGTICSRCYSSSSLRATGTLPWVGWLGGEKLVSCKRDWLLKQRCRGLTKIVPALRPLVDGVIESVEADQRGARRNDYPAPDYVALTAPLRPLAVSRHAMDALATVTAAAPVTESMRVSANVRSTRVLARTSPADDSPPGSSSSSSSVSPSGTPVKPVLAATAVSTSGARRARVASSQQENGVSSSRRGRFGAVTDGDGIQCPNMSPCRCASSKD